MSEEKRIEVEFIGPRTVSVIIYGDFDAEQATVCFDRIEELVKDLPYFLLEVIMNHIEATTAEARRIAATRLSQLPRRVIAITGGGFYQRIAAKLVLTAALMIDRANTRGQTSVFPESEAARDWLTATGFAWDAELKVARK